MQRDKTLMQVAGPFVEWESSRWKSHVCGRATNLNSLELLVILANHCSYVLFMWTSVSSPGPESLTKQDYKLNDIWWAISFHFSSLSWNNETKDNKKTAKEWHQGSVISNHHISSVQKNYWAEVQWERNLSNSYSSLVGYFLPQHLD